MAVNIHSGLFDKRATFKAPVWTEDGQGGRLPTYPLDTLTTWVQVVPVNNYRVMEAGASALVDSIRIRVRYRENTQAITKDWQVTFDGANYTIQSIQDLEGARKVIELVIRTKTDG